MDDHIILDTNIYKSLGHDFYQKSDYRNLFEFASKQQAIILLSPIVIREFINHYSIERNKYYKKYYDAISSFEKDTYFINPEVEFPDIHENISLAKENFERHLLHDPFYNAEISKIPSNLVDPEVLTDFILKTKNKDDKKNIQIRDYLIWDSILNYAKRFWGTQEINTNIKVKRTGVICFITNDKGFTNDELFKELKFIYNVSNILIFGSIAEYLLDRGYNLPFVTAELIKSAIPESRIITDLLENSAQIVRCLEDEFEGSDLKDVRLSSEDSVNSNFIDVPYYYSFKDKYSLKLKFFTQIEVLAILDLHLKRPILSATTGHRFDRSLITRPILVSYEGELNETKKCIESVRFIKLAVSTV